MDPTLDYLSRYLLEEEIDELNISACKDQAALQDIEKRFYEIVGQKYPPTPNEQPTASSQSESDLSPSSSSTSKSSISVNDALVESIPVMEFHRGIEEGMKFLPIINKLSTDNKENIVSVDSAEVKYKNSGALKLVEKVDLGMMPTPRNSVEPIKDNVYDKVLLDHGDDHLKEEIWSLRETLQLEASSGVLKEIQGDHHELYTLLIHCSEAVAIYDRRIAQELLTKIRLQSSPNGNGIQRLASVLADALEARLAGVGSEYYRGLIAKRFSTPDIYFLKAYHLYLRAAPFARVFYSFSNRMLQQEMPEKFM
ncbi:GRAS transcription factor [Rhynchospora pubera]|uniref:GRAS transcription factor n=1 Tax=Rhynchospora pubera TaxID=906938 RepID=A0AAV8EG94_9POAL|nr:GRAS transcription factor [Rhynchospora pubera]